MPKYMTSFQSSPVRIWNTVNRAIENVLKFVGGVPSSKLNCPPKSCIPNSAKMRMNKKSRKSREIMDLIEFRSDITRFLNDDQYFVTLKILKRRKARRTESPNDPPLTSDQITSKIDPLITTQSKRLNDDSKYILGPRAYIFINISHMKRPRNKYSVTSKIRKAEVDLLEGKWTLRKMRVILT